VQGVNTTTMKTNITGTVDFINDKEIVRVKGKGYYNISYNPPTNKLVTLYSLPNNNVYEPYTPKPNCDLSKAHDVNVVLAFWSIFKKGDIIQGQVINNVFVYDETTRPISLQGSN
jgi:hypothetical protein